MKPDRNKTASELLIDIKWLGIVQVYNQALMLEELRAINEGITHVATEAQVQQLKEEIDAFEAASDFEKGQINRKLDELIAAAGGTDDPVLQEQIERLKALRQVVSGFIPDEPAEPPVEPPVEEPTEPPAEPVA